MPTHDQFEEMCALASTGEIGSAEARLLEDHLEECADCQRLLQDLREIHAQWLPAHRNTEDAAEIQDWRLRQSILREASRAGAQFSQEALAGVAHESIFLSHWRSLAIASLTVVVIAAVLLGVRHRVEDGHRASASTPRTVPGAVAVVAASEEKSPDKELDQVKGERDSLKRQLENSKWEIDRLQAALGQVQTHLQTSGESAVEKERQISELEQQLDAAQRLQSATATELDRLRTTNETMKVADNEEIRELNRKLDTQGASLDRERDMLSAGREIRDLIAARNLHIIDVYDTNSDGKTSRAFGRVFYTEGKSLVFYAYDLNQHKAEAAKLAYYVWGKRDAAPQDIKSLGQMSIDEQGQKRWALTITDPKVLAEIDSVFVTLEPADNKNAKPSGKALLSAFLGSPANHP